MPSLRNAMLVVVKTIRTALNGYEQRCVVVSGVQAVRRAARRFPPRSGISAGVAVSVSEAHGG
jgi:hypothetical protein